MKFKLFAALTILFASNFYYGMEEQNQPSSTEINEEWEKLEAIKSNGPLVFIPVLLVNMQNSSILLCKKRTKSDWTCPGSWLQIPDGSVLNCAERTVSNIGMRAYNLRQEYTIAAEVRTFEKKDLLVHIAYSTKDFSGTPVSKDSTEEVQWFKQNELPSCDKITPKNLLYNVIQSYKR